MCKTFHVEALWDADAELWVSRSDVPGLVIETATLGEFEVLVRALARELLADDEGGVEGVSIAWTVSRVFDLQVA